MKRQLNGTELEDRIRAAQKSNDPVMVTKLTITLMNNGSMNVNGPLHDKILCYGILQSAADVIRNYSPIRAGVPINNPTAEELAAQNAGQPPASAPITKEDLEALAANPIVAGAIEKSKPGLIQSLLDKFH